MPEPKANRPPAKNLEAILDEARRNMQQKMAASEAAANSAFAKVTDTNPRILSQSFADDKDNVIPAVGFPIMNQATQDTQPANRPFTHTRFASGGNYTTQFVNDAFNRSANTSRNTSRGGEYQLRPGTVVPPVTYHDDTPTKNKPRARSQPAMPTSPTTPTRLATPFQPQSRRNADRDQKRYLEAMEPDPEDDNMLLWESWALRRLIKEQLGIDDQDIRAYLGQEYEHALERKELREKLERTELRSDWGAYLAGRQVAHNAEVTHRGPPPRLQY